MQDWIHIERVLRVESMEEASTITADYARKLGFGHCGYAISLPGAAAGAESRYHYFHNFRAEWGRTYELLRRADVEREDPRILQARANLPATAWNSRGDITYTRQDIVRQARRMLHMAGEFGLHLGITVPVQAPGLRWAFATFTANGIGDVREMMPLIASVSYYISCLQVAVDRMLRETSIPRLSLREKDVLAWSAAGKTSWEISMILAISERTVNFYLQQAARKLGVKGRQAAATRAIALGLLVP